jgi:HNH endonuclease/AP2 domain
MMNMITQEQLKEAFNYDDETGIFTWKIQPSFGIKIGSIAGNTRKDNYVVIRIFNKRYLSHRLAWFYQYGYWPKELDHINGIKNDNRLVNLRECAQGQNQKNIGIRADNKSGYKGVIWHKQIGKWEARARLNNKPYYLGVFADIKEAAKAYQEFAKKHHGEFLHASLN